MNNNFEDNTSVQPKRHRRHKKKTVMPKLILTASILLCTIIAIPLIKETPFTDSKPYDNITSTGTSSSVATNGNSPTSNQSETDWRLILVNAWNNIPDNYKATCMTLDNGRQIDERIYPDLQEMFDTARKEGVYPLIGEAYRTNKEQQRLYTDKINAYVEEGHAKKEAEVLAKTWVALPGTSEHQLGLALDINAEKEKCTNDVVYQWLSNNSYKYGFILRYPPNKSAITGVNYEPWHYRYVGRETAKKIYEQGVCLEEYLNNLE